MIETAQSIEKRPRYFVWERGPYYFEIRDRATGDYVDIRVGSGARESAVAECARLNESA